MKTINRTDRLLLTVKLLQSRPMTASELEAALKGAGVSVSQRTLERDREYLLKRGHAEFRLCLSGDVALASDSVGTV